MLKALIAVALLSSFPALAQHSHYAGQEARDIKSLSEDEVQQYLSGAGMGYAKPAELNQYPGPMHALELAERLKLTTEQRGALKALMDSHKAQAREIGKRLVDAERALEGLFKSGKVEAGELRAKVEAAAALQAEYRLAHLETHRRARSLFTDEQVKQYDALRGYGKAGAQRHKH